MKRNSIIVSFLIIVFIASFLVFNGCDKKEEDVIKIGAILPLSGEASSYGVACKQGMEIASKKFGYQIIYEDSKADPKTAVNAINKLIGSDNVKIIIGDMFSNATLAIKPIAIRNNILLITPTGASTEIPDSRNNIFSIYPSTKNEGSFLANYLIDKNIGDNFLALTSNEDVFKEMVLGFANKLKENNINVSSLEFEKNKNDYRNVIIKIKQFKNLSGIYLTGYKDDLATIIKQMKEFNISLPIFSQSTLYDQEFLTKHKSILDNVIFTAPYFSIDNLNNKDLSEFIQSYQKDFGTIPDVWAAYGFDAIFIIKEAGGIKSKISDITTNILNIKDVDLLTGPITFNSDGSANRSFKIFKINKQKFIEIN